MAGTSSSFTFKAGDTFPYLFTWAPDPGDPATLSGYTVTAGVLDKFDNLQTVTCTTSDNIIFDIPFLPAQTKLWNVGQAKTDILIVLPGTGNAPDVVTHTDTLYFTVDKPVTPYNP